jgi:hypothetical protein
LAQSINAEPNGSGKSAPPAGHNGPTQEKIHQHARAIIAANLKVQEAQAARQSVRKLAKADGVELGKLDTIISMMDWEPGEVRAHFKTLIDYAVWFELPIGTQVDLFAGVPDAAKPALDWESKGYQAAVTGKGVQGKAPEDCPADCIQAWLTGWNRGQEKNAPKKLEVVN